VGHGRVSISSLAADPPDDLWLRPAPTSPPGG
jgi:hypothetical protein